MYDTIIVGGGPAGLTSAIYLRRANKKVLVLEANVCGGQIVNAKDVENYPGYEHISGFDFSENLRKQVLNLGAEIKYETVLKVDEDKKVYTSNNVYEAKSVILAVGSKNRKLKIDNEDKFTGRGISYCATCDGNFYKDKIACVYGNTSTALDDVVYLSNICKEVYLVVRNDSLKENNLESFSNVHIIYNSTITKLLGDNLLTGIELNNNETINTDALFVAIGQVPETENFINILDLDSKGYAITSDNRTKIKGIYVCGDVVEKPLRQLATAIGDGAMAATAAIQDINNKII